MKSRYLIFLLVVGIALVLSAKGHARPDETDLKSDLELEIEGKSTKKKPQNETAEPKKKEKGLPYKGGPLVAATPTPTPEPEKPSPTPFAAATPKKSNPVLDMPIPPPLPPAAPVEKGPKIEPPKPAAHAPPARDLEGLIARAKREYDQKHFDKAIALLRPVIDQLPRVGLVLLARCYAAINDSLNEIRTLELCLAKNPKDYIVQTDYGDALYRAKRVEDALVAFQESRNLNPHYRPAYEAMLKVLEEKGENYEARNVVNDMIKNFGGEPTFFTALCRLYWREAYHEKVVEFCQTATEKAPKVPENYVYLGLSLIDREELEKSHRVLTNAARKFPNSEPVQTAMGDLYLAKKDYVAAYNYYRRAAIADTKSARAWIGLGNSAFELQKNQEALDAYTKACSINKTQTKEFRSAIGRLRVLKDTQWQSKFEMGISNCM